MLVCTTGFTGGFRAANEETRPHHHALRAQRNRSRNPAPVHHPASREERRGEGRGSSGQRRRSASAVSGSSEIYPPALAVVAEEGVVAALEALEATHRVSGRLGGRYPQSPMRLLRCLPV